MLEGQKEPLGAGWGQVQVHGLTSGPAEVLQPDGDVVCVLK